MPGYETFYRDEPLEVRATLLPAELYNRAHTLLSRSPGSCLFVPIRTIQYMAVIDDEEIIFVDREAKHLVELAWRNFRPQARSALHEPVPYELHIYLKKAFDILLQLQGEFHKALQLMSDRHQTTRLNETGEGQVVPFRTPPVSE